MSRIDVRKLMPGATSCLECFVNATKGDKILIITDNIEIAEALAEASNKAGAEVMVYYLPQVLRPIKHLNDTLRKLIEYSTVVFTPFDDIEEESSFRKEIVELAGVGIGRKIAHMPSVTPKMFMGKGMLSLNSMEMQKMIERTEKLAMLLSATKKVIIQSAAHRETNLSLDLVGWNRSGIVSTGHIMKGSWGNLPSGEAFVLPKRNTAQGTIVIDKAISNLPYDDLPATIVITNGRVDIDSIKDGKSLKNLLKKCPDSMRTVCEFGIGTNPKHASNHALIENEKMLKTIHIAIGNNLVFGGDIEAPKHIDMVISKPTVLVRGLLSDENENEMICIIEGGQIRDERINSFFSVYYESFTKEIKGDAVITVKQGISVEDKGEFLFTWDEISKNDRARFIEFLQYNFCINWVDMAQIKKPDDLTFIASTKDNFVELVLNNEKTKAILKIDDGRTTALIVKKENGNLNIYKGDDMLYRCWQDHRGHKLRIPVGNVDTAKKVMEVWGCFDHAKPESVKNIIKNYNKKFNGGSELVYQLLNTLEKFGIIEITRPIDEPL